MEAQALCAGQPQRPRRGFRASPARLRPARHSPVRVRSRRRSGIAGASGSWRRPRPPQERGQPPQVELRHGGEEYEIAALGRLEPEQARAVAGEVRGAPAPWHRATSGAGRAAARRSCRFAPVNRACVSRCGASSFHARRARARAIARAARRAAEASMYGEHGLPAGTLAAASTVCAYG